jgi:uncharacterized protein YcfJ
MSYFKIIGFFLLSLVTTGCANNLSSGLIAGSSVGAGLGGTIGSGRGALIGGLAGVVSGGLVGVALDLQDRKVIERSSPRTVDRMDRGDPLTLSDVIKLSQGGVNDDTIMQYIRDTGSSYSLSQAQVRRLQDSGVSQRVINYMSETGR